GALMPSSRCVLKMLEGMDRPAIATQKPNRLGGMTTELDVGANVDCEPEHMLQFAMMGAALVTALDRKERPTVGLLNIGEEVIKGNETVKRAAELLRSANLNFVGNVEGNDVFSGKADVIVCDGFVGNVALKTSEGLAQMLAGFIREEYERHLFTRLLAVLSFPVLRRFRNRLDHRRFNGAALVGLRGVVVKSHGSADAFAFEAALRRRSTRSATGCCRASPTTWRGPPRRLRRGSRSRSPPPKDRTSHDSIQPHRRHGQLPARRAGGQRHPCPSPGREGR